MPENNEPKLNSTEVDLALTVTELEGLVAQKDEAVGLAQARVTELEQTVANLNGKLTTLDQALAERDLKLADIAGALSQAVASYKALVIKANPQVPAELMTGDSIEAVDRSLENARSLVSKVRQGLEAEIKMAKVPVGAPLRVAADLSALSPREKIQYAVGERR